MHIIYRNYVVNYQQSIELIMQKKYSYKPKSIAIFTITQNNTKF